MSGRRGFFSSKRVKNLFGLKGKRQEEDASGGGGKGGEGGPEEITEFRKFELPKVNMEMDEVRRQMIRYILHILISPLLVQLEESSESTSSAVTSDNLFRRASDPFEQGRPFGTNLKDSGDSDGDNSPSFQFNANKFSSPTVQKTGFDNSKFRQANRFGTNGEPLGQSSPQFSLRPSPSIQGAGYSSSVSGGTDRSQGMQQSQSTYNISSSPSFQPTGQQGQQSPAYEPMAQQMQMQQMQMGSPAVHNSASQNSLHESILDDMDEVLPFYFRFALINFANFHTPQHLMNDLLSEV
jgi:hypothetical protein